LRDRIVTSQRCYERGVPVCIAKREGDDLPLAAALTKNNVVRMAEALCIPRRKAEKTTLPNRVADIYLDMAGEWKLPAFKAISTAPILADDGSIRVGSGYDATTGLYLHDVPELAVPREPTTKQAQAALLVLRESFETFPFADASTTNGVVDHSKPMGTDESAFITALITAVCRQSLPLAPGLLLNAPSFSGAGSGKGLLVRAISGIAYGYRPFAFTRGDGPQETDKRLVAAMIEGRPLVFLDNCNMAMLRSDTLASFITEEICAVRPLGRSQMIQIHNGTFFAVTGNGLTITEDLVRRFLQSSLDARMENPELREFAPGFLTSIKRRREELLTAALTVWRFGRQNTATIPAGIALGSFEQWGRWVRDPLLALGCPDPVARVKELKARDPRRQRVGEIFALWWEHHRSDALKVAGLAAEVREAIDPGQKRSRNYVAARVAELVGTRLAGFALEVFEPGGAGKRGTRYRLLRTEPEKYDGHAKPSAPPASSAISGEKPEASDSYKTEATADGFDRPETIRRASAEHPQPITVKEEEQNQWFAESDADSADSADGFPHAAKIRPENRHEPEPGQITARVWIREIRPVPLGPPGDSLDDFTA
jgi:hypothetical protein